jgi:hypothetical protein
MSANPAGDTATGRPSPTVPGAPNTTRGFTVDMPPTTSKIEQDLVNHRSSAAASWGRSARLPLSTSVNSIYQLAGADKSGDGRPLRIEPEAGLTLPVGADALIGDDALHRFKFRCKLAGVRNLKVV